MHLMGKNYRSPTPQEIYRARKQKEEDERNGFLPPGLINHGNTCFMNSVLQGLIATPMLADVVRFKLPESYSPVLSRRSPQLTNGHGLGGEWERGWEPGMPLGDVFVSLMTKAWKIQEERQRLSMIPRELLTRLGAKYDQYLDFRQQDAHELLRHLLDAMRMEELDIIKKRQPQPKAKRRRVSDLASSLASRPSTPDSPVADTDQLISFVDMVFGGRLASILVCEKCKKISCTYEDFNDLSLSIQPEDYARDKERKRDRLRGFARRLGIRGRDSDHEGTKGPRASSVPASPTRHSIDSEYSLGAVMGDMEQRRRSLDADEEATSLGHDREKPTSEITGAASAATPEENKDKGEDEKVKESLSREKEKDEEDGWVKLRRRISVGVGVKKSKKSSKPKHQERLCEDVEEESQKDDDAPDPSAESKAASFSPNLGTNMMVPKFSFSRRPSPSRRNATSPAASVATSDQQSPTLQPIAPLEKRPLSPALLLPLRKKSSRLPKPSRAEAAYLRQLLADVPTHAASKLDSFFNPLGASSIDTADTRPRWFKLGHAQSVEECLRMFTAVEVLDGENMVGCRRCWKIQNGEYESRGRSGGTTMENSSSDDEGSSANSDSNPGIDIKAEKVDDPNDTMAFSEGTQAIINVSSEEETEGSQVDLDPKVPPGLPAPIPHISMTGPDTTMQMDGTGTLIPDVQDAAGAPRTLKQSLSCESLPLPLSSRLVRRSAERQRLPIRTTSDTHSLSSYNGSGDELEDSETSLTASIQSISSSDASVPASSLPPVSAPVLLDHSGQSNLGEADGSSRLQGGIGKPSLPLPPHQSDFKSHSPSPDGQCVPRSKQVVLRRAYKRYLIATPPPVLVVHLKRFQQMTNKPTTSFHSFANFKKLDNPVRFPEYLDLSPYLMPNKEDFGLGRRRVDSKVNQASQCSANSNGKARSCMYRLYAVVVHIGNMLGGHYIAYTALPEAASSPAKSHPSQRESHNGEKDASSITASSTSSLDKIYPESPRTMSFIRTAYPPTSSRASSFSTTVSSHVPSDSASGSGSESHGGENGMAPAPIPRRKWCYISDTIVRLADLEEVLKAKAYICMYEHI